MPARSTFPALDALLLLFILNLSLQPLVEPDFGWHLRTGLDLLNGHWQLPITDPYSHTMPDWLWVEHAWLTDALLGVIYSSLGGLGVILLFAAIVAGAFFVSAATAAAGRTARWLAVGAAAWVGLPFWGARVQMITLLGFATVLWLWRRYAAGQSWPLWGIPPLFLAWANLHGGFTAGLFLLGVILATSIVVRSVADHRPSLAARIDEPILSWRRIGGLGLALVLAAGVTVINPYGLRLHGEIVQSLTDQLMLDTLHEWQPVSIEHRAGRLFIGYLVTVGIGALVWYRRIEPVRTVVTAVFLILALRYWRNVPFMLLAAVPLTAELVTALAQSMARTLPILQRQSRRWLLAAACAVAAGLVILGADHLKRVAACGLAPVAFFSETEYPIEAADWIRQHRDELGTRLYNDYGFGGFLLWWLPAERIFIDGRMPAWRIGERWIFYDYLAVTHWDPPELRVLDKYGVDWGITAVGSTLEQAIRTRAEWQIRYEDRKVSVFVRRASLHSGSAGPGKDPLASRLSG